jgi:hypothetical protein
VNPPRLRKTAANPPRPDQGAAAQARPYESHEPDPKTKGYAATNPARDTGEHANTGAEPRTAPDTTTLATKLPPDPATTEPPTRHPPDRD